jgi:hypothetical protein
MLNCYTPKCCAYFFLACIINRFISLKILFINKIMDFARPQSTAFKSGTVAPSTGQPVNYEIRNFLSIHSNNKMLHCYLRQNAVRGPAVS